MPHTTPHEVKPGDISGFDVEAKKNDEGLLSVTGSNVVFKDGFPEELSVKGVRYSLAKVNDGKELVVAKYKRNKG